MSLTKRFHRSLPEGQGTITRPLIIDSLSIHAASRTFRVQGVIGSRLRDFCLVIYAEGPCVR